MPKAINVEVTLKKIKNARKAEAERNRSNNS